MKKAVNTYQIEYYTINECRAVASTYSWGGGGGV
jgi:hypothetical protein